MQGFFIWGAFCVWNPQAARILVGLFLIGVTPLGLEEVPNIILAAGIGFLLTQEFRTDAWTMLRRHRRRRSQPAEREATTPRARRDPAGVKAR